MGVILTTADTALSVLPYLLPYQPVVDPMHATMAASGSSQPLSVLADISVFILSLCRDAA